MNSAHNASTPTRELHRLVGDVDVFVASAWQKAPLLHRGTDTDGPMDLDDVDDLLAGTALRLPYLAMSGGGEDLPPSTYTRIAEVTGVPIFGVVDADKVHRHLRAGNTLALFMLNHLIPSVRRYCRRLSEDLECHCSLGAYVSPDHQHAFPAHADREDNFIWQLVGEKKWTLWAPFADYRRRRVTEADLGDPVLEVRLRPGDCLYVPRGTPHLVESLDSLSLHLTISALVSTMREQLLASVRTVLENPEFDTALPTSLLPSQSENGYVATMSRLLRETDGASAGTLPTKRFEDVQPLVAWAALVDVPGTRWRWTEPGLSLRRTADSPNSSRHSEIMRSFPAQVEAWQLAGTGAGTDTGNGPSPNADGRSSLRKLVLAGLVRPAQVPRG